MTVETTSVLSGPFTGNGITKRFPRGFPIYDASHVAVQVDGVIVTTGYTVLDAGDATGDVEFDTAPAIGSIIYLTRETPSQQDSDYSSQGTVSPEQIEKDLDRRTLVEQELRRDLERTVKVPLGSTGIQMADIDEGQIVVSGPNKTLIAGGSSDLFENAQAYAQTAQAARDEAKVARDEAQTARDEAEQFAKDTKDIVTAVPVGSDLKGKAGKILAVLPDESGYGFSSSFSEFYGLNVTNGSLIFDRGTGNYTASDFIWSGIFPGGITFSINSRGHMVATT